MNAVRSSVLAVSFVAAAVPVLAQSGAAPAPRPEPPGSREVRKLQFAGLSGAEIGVVAREGDTASADGVLVDDVRNGGPADKAGVRKADTIVLFDGERVRSVRQFRRLVAESRAGHAVKMTISRDGQKKEVQVTPEARSLEAFADLERIPDPLPDMPDMMYRTWPAPAPPDMPDMMYHTWPAPAPPAQGRFGVTATQLSPQLADYFGAGSGGLLVTSVAQDSPAERAGLKAGDVVTAANGEAVRMPSDLSRAVRRADGQAVSLSIMREKQAMTMSVKP